MKINKVKWFFLIIATIAMMIILFIYFPPSLITQGEDAQENTKDSETTKSTIKSDDDYQTKITSFDEKQYDLPTPQLSEVNQKLNCVNGFGGDLPKIYSGVFSERLYSFNVAILPTSEPYKLSYAPYVDAYTVTGDILFKKPMDLFDRKIVTIEQLERNLSDSRIIVGNQSYKNSYTTMESKYGFPVAYLSQQAGKIITLSTFNDTCVKNIGKKRITFARIDLSGYPISTVFSAKYQTSLYHGVNGLYNYTSFTSNFFTQDFFSWLTSNLTLFTQLTQLERSFSKGAFVYIPIEYELVDESVTVNFKEPLYQIVNERTAPSLNEWKSLIIKKHEIAKDKVVFIEEKFKDFTIYKASQLKDNGDIFPLDEAIAVKNGVLYSATWELPGKKSITVKDAERSSLVLFNMVSVTDLLSSIKFVYQGKKLDIGTDNENLDELISNTEH